LEKRLVQQPITGGLPAQQKLVILSKLIFIGVVFGLIIFLFTNFESSYTITDSPQTKLPPRVPKVTLESIFTKQNDMGKLDQNNIITLMATGDVILARGANWPSVTSGDFTLNWKKVAPLLKKGDITLINLEAPLIKNCPLLTKGMLFCGDSRHIQGLIFADIDSVSLANNHIDNYGQSGIDETTSLFEKNGIGWSGFGNLDIRKVKNIKFGFLAFNGIEITFDRAQIKKEIKEAREKVDILVVAAHWGDEYVLTPRKYGNIAPDNPQEIGRLIIDAGADLIIGNHPHTVQGVEIYKEKLITYAHGNFIFDQTWSQKTQEGVVGEYTFYIFELEGQTPKAEIVNAKFHPIFIGGNYQPYFLSKEKGQHTLERMLKSSKSIKEK
jgi:poly-gamma-glutamate synthesis protein (capsule biosynthesis protein)